MKRILILIMLLTSFVFAEDNAFTIKDSDKEIVKISQLYNGIVTFSINVSTEYVRNTVFVQDPYKDEDILYQEFLNKTVKELLVGGIDILKKCKIEKIVISYEKKKQRKND